VLILPRVCCSARLHVGLASLRDPRAKLTAVKRLAALRSVPGDMAPHTLCERVESAMLTAKFESNRHESVEQWLTELEASDRQLKRMWDEAGSSRGGKSARSDDGSGGTRGVESAFVSEMGALITSQQYQNQLQRLLAFAAKVGVEAGHTHASMLELFLTVKTPEELKPTAGAARLKREADEDALEPLTVFHQIFNFHLTARRVDSALSIVELCLTDEVFAELLVTLACRHYWQGHSGPPSCLVTLRMLK
jgi:hypothetical protein